MDRAKWKSLLAEAPPSDDATAELFGTLLIEWTWERFQRWYPDRLRQDLRLVQDLEEVCSQFLLLLHRVRFACLVRVAPEAREAYLARVLRNIALRYFKRIGNLPSRQVVLLDAASTGEEEEEIPNLEALADSAPTPEEAAMQHFEMDMIREFLRTLKPDERKVFDCVFWEGLKEKETARLLEMPEGTVRSHVCRMRTKLAQWWTNHGL